jgi:transglutaminase-like putative cysteine protease
MNRRAKLTGVLLILLGAAIAGWKALVLGLPLAPSDPEGLWGVEIVVKARGRGGQGSIRVPLPATEPGQVVFDERSVSDRLRFTIRTQDGQRMGVWSGVVDGTHDIAHGFRVQLGKVDAVGPRPEAQTADEGAEKRESFEQPTVELPSQANEVAELLESLPLPDRKEVADRARVLFAFVHNEVATIETGSTDALLTLAAREGRPEGKARLLATLLRAAGVPARLGIGVRLVPDGAPRAIPFVEARMDGTWVPMSPSEDFFGERPPELLVLRRGSLELVEATGVEAATQKVHALRERLRPEELAMIMAPANQALARLSLYRLPVATQATLRALLLLPLGALVVTLFRNVIGVQTFGTFMPVLIAFTLRETSLPLGLAMVVAVVVLGILGRILLDRLHLLMVPRLSVLLCVVVLGLTAMALAGRGFENGDLLSGVLLPIVILTMLIERFSVTLAEEGLNEALKRAAWSLIIAVVVYPIFRNTFAEQLMFGYPELLFVVMGLLVLIGSYAGYRLTDLIRFRSFAQEEDV